jgi:hypothetical protein
MLSIQLKTPVEHLCDFRVRHDITRFDSDITSHESGIVRIVSFYDIRARLIDLYDAQSPTEDFDTLGKRLGEIERNFIEIVNDAQESRASNKERFDRIERKLDLIVAAVCVSDTDRSQEEAEDRKRLKERLKEALEQSTNSRKLHLDTEKENWVEYLFGICKPDGRVGKEGSR